MEFHEAANIFPMLPEEKLDCLADDIKKNGLQYPVEICDGKIIDGRNRWMACLRAGVDADTVDVCPDDPIAYVLSLNLHRRHLDATQQSMIAARAKSLYEKAAKERMLAGKKVDPVENLPQGDVGKARDKAGEAVGVSGRSVDHASKVLERGSKALIDACDRGEVAVSAAAKLTELPKSKQTEVLKQAIENHQPLKKAVAKAAKHVIPQPDADWTTSEVERRKIVERGGTVVANKRSDKCLLRWASEVGLLTPIDRGTPWGNPFLLDADGTRDEICDAYEWYLTHKPSLTGSIDKLKGRVLACWCYPERCHGDSLVKECGCDR